MNEYFKLLQPQACFDYVSAEKSIQLQFQIVMAEMQDMNIDTEKFQQMLFASAPDNQAAYFIKEKKVDYWINTEQVISINPEWEEVFQGAFSICSEWVQFYKEKAECNIIVFYIDVYNNFWIYCFLDSLVRNFDSAFIHKYIGEVLDKDATAEMLKKLYC